MGIWGKSETKHKQDRKEAHTLCNNVGASDSLLEGKKKRIFTFKEMLFPEGGRSSGPGTGLFKKN